MRKKAAFWWVLAAGLAVALSVCLPGLVFRAQDAKLERMVESAAVETVDLSLLSNLTVEQTLYLVRNYESRVALEQGRQLNADQAGRLAVDAVTGVCEIFGGGSAIGTRQAVPWLYVSRSGESVILWQVELAGAAQNVLRHAMGDGWTGSVGATVLIDERTGFMVSLDLRWTDEPLPTPTPEVMPTAEIINSAELVEEPVEWDSVSGMYGVEFMDISDVVFGYIFQTLKLQEWQRYDDGWFFIVGDDQEYYIETSLTVERIRFNA